MVSFGRISPNSFLSSILLVVVIIVTVVIVVVILIVVVVAIVGVVIVVVVIGVVIVVGGVSFIIKLSFMVIGFFLRTILLYQESFKFRPECSSCGSLYTSNCGCSKGSLEDKILVPKPPRNCARCGTPVDGPYCQGCALLRKEFMEGLLTNCVENEFFKDLQDTSESSDDNTNVVNAPREPIVVNQDPGENSSPSPPHIDHCCHECGDSLDGIFCRQCTCKSCGKGAHYGYNCPPQIPIISKPEPCNNKPLMSPTKTSQSLHNNLSSCDARYGHYCTPQVPFIYPEPGYNQDFNFPQNFHGFPQQYPCCENCGGPHETYQCQPMNEDYYHEQNSCYDYNSFGFDQFQPPQYTVNHPISNVQNSLFNAQNEFLNSQNKLMEQMTSLCDMVGQIMQKKEEERRTAEEQAAKDQYWKIPICYDDDDDYTSAITPVLPTKEPVNSLSMGDEHLDTISTTESDEVIKSSIENLIPIPSKSEGIPDSTIIDSNDDSTSSDDDSFENIDYVDASPPDVEIVSLEVVEIVISEVGGIDTDILLTIKDDILREKLLNVNLLIANIEALKDNPALSSDVMTKSSSTSLNLFLEETNTFDNSSRKRNVVIVNVLTLFSITMALIPICNTPILTYSSGS
ncbi:hypothetical protein Tco_0575159 [Tanacetum coccineum]